MSEKNKNQSNDFEELVNRTFQQIRELIHQGNARHVVVTTQEDEVVLDTTLTIAAVAAIAMILWTMPLLLIAVVIALATRVRVDIVRVIDEVEEPEVLDEEPHYLNIEEDEQESMYN